MTPKSSRKGDFFLYRYVMPKWSVFLAILWRSAGGLRSMLAVPLYALKDQQLLKPKQSAQKEKENNKVNVDKKAEGKSKDYHRYHYCPMDGCTALVKRMPLHLKKVHKLLLDSVEFKAALSRVRRLVSDSPRRRYHERRSNLGKDKGESSVGVEALEDNEDEINVRRRSSHRRVKILDDSESESV